MQTTTFFTGRIVTLIVLLLIVVGVLVYKNTQDTSQTPPAQQVSTVENIIGCYTSVIEKDVYTLNIQTQDGNSFKGTLRFKNFEKDSSSGTYVGLYKNNILSGEYAFQSEGLDSVMNIIFKKVGDNFVRGLETGDTGSLAYDETVPGSLFAKSNCL